MRFGRRSGSRANTKALAFACPGASAAPAPSWSAAHFDHHGTPQREIGALTEPASTSTPATAETVPAPREKTTKKT
jgi:hypothetical protein